MRFLQGFPPSPQLFPQVWKVGVCRVPTAAFRSDFSVHATCGKQVRKGVVYTRSAREKNRARTSLSLP
jgi:hypothetical protein